MCLSSPHPSNPKQAPKDIADPALLRLRCDVERDVILAVSGIFRHEIKYAHKAIVRAKDKSRIIYKLTAPLRELKRFFRRRREPAP